MDRLTIVQRFAPLILAKAEEEWPAADCITGVDYTGTIADAAENPDKLMQASPKKFIDEARVYYSVCETTTHWFVLYAVYHPLDWYRRGKATKPRRPVARQERRARVHAAQPLVAGGANPPWSWYDHNDPSYAGEIAADPASIILRYVNGWGPASRH